MSTVLDARPETQTGDGDHERFAHYVRGRNGMQPQDLILEAMLSGTEVEALCGKRWIPSRDPERFPVCPACKEIRAQLATA